MCKPVTLGGIWGRTRICKHSAFVSVASRGASQPGRPGEPALVRVMRCMGLLPSLQSIRCHPALWGSGPLGTGCGCFVALQRVSAVCFQEECLHFSRLKVYGKALYSPNQEGPSVPVRFTWAWGSGKGTFCCLCPVFKTQTTQSEIQAPSSLRRTCGIAGGGHVLLLYPLLRCGG